jgi:hypothetical protein
MLRNNFAWIFVFTGTALMERGRAMSTEEQVPEFLLQFLDLSLKIRDEGCLFLEPSRSN